MVKCAALPDGRLGGLVNASPFRHIEADLTMYCLSSLARRIYEQKDDTRTRNEDSIEMFGPKNTPFNSYVMRF